MALTSLAQALDALPPAEAARLHAQAIDNARGGNFIPALRTLERLRAQDPANRRYVYDYVLVLTWAEKDQAALDLAPLVDRAAAPIEVVEALAKAARNRRRFELAESLYRAAASREPERLAARIGLGLTLADAKRADESLALFDDLHRGHPDEIEVLFAYGYTAESKRDFVRALWAYDKVLERDPANRRALRLKALAAASLGIPHVALELAYRHPGLLSKAETDRIEADRIALHVRWGELPPLTRGARFAETDKALQLMDEQYRGDWSRLDLSVPKHRRLAFDRMVALRERARMTEVVDLHRQLVAAKVEIPDYALLAAGSAYLYLEQPEEALPIAEQVLEHDPANFSARLSLFYTYIELDDFAKALRVIDKLNAEQTPWLNRGGEARPNPQRQITEIATGYGRALADDLAGAQERFESMLTIAPENTEVRKELATVYRWRGWSERALAEFDYIAMREPDYLDNQVQLATTELALDLYPRAEAGVARLLRDYPEDTHVRRLGREWDLHNRPEFGIATRAAEADDGGELGTSEIKNDALLYSSPIAHHYRAFFRDHFFTAEFAEGTASDHRVGGGLEYRRHRLRMSGELYQGTEDDHQLGFAVLAGWRQSDQLRFEGAAEYDSIETPLRAIGSGISAHRFGGSAEYSWNESQQATLDYRFFDFDDGNLRHAIAGAFHRRLVNLPQFKLTGILDLYASTNRASDVIYYSPKKDFSWSVTFDSDWRLYRRYERSFSHRLAATVGQYYEDEFDPGTTWSFAYQHDWQLSEALRFAYGVMRSRRVFDGEPEFESAVYGNLMVRF